LRGIERRRLLGGDTGDTDWYPPELRPFGASVAVASSMRGVRARCAAASRRALGLLVGLAPGNGGASDGRRDRAVSSAQLPVTVTVTVPEPAVVDLITRSRMSCSVVPWSATEAPLVSTASLPTRRW
jgi:hypothetical protein